MNKVTVSTVLTFILALWEMISPTAEVIFGIGTKGMSIIALIITIITFAYDYFFAKESVLKAFAEKHIGTRPKKPRD